MTSEVGSGQVAIFPTFKGFRGAVTRETEGAGRDASKGFQATLGKAGKDTGKATGVGFKTAFEGSAQGFSAKATKSLEADVAKAARSLSAARLKEQDATGKVRVAEAQLAADRKRYASDSVQVIRAEERLASASRSLSDTQDKARSSTNDLRDAQANLARAADRAGDEMSESGRRGGAGFKSNFLSGVKSIAGPLALVIGTLGIGNMIGDAVQAGFSFVQESITGASGLNESLNAIEVAYGDAADEIGKLGTGAAERLGLSNVDFNSIATQFSSFASTIRGEDVGGFIDELSTRGADFASVYNIEVAEALRLFQSGLAGETEPLRKYGLDLSAATVEAYALANGIGAAGEPLTEAQKQQARYAALMAQTQKVQGDFKNTSGELANQQRILQASFADTQAELGMALLPAMAEFVNLANDDLMPMLRDLVAEVGPVLADALKESAPAFSEMLLAIAPMIPELVKLGTEALPPLIDLLILMSPLLIDWATSGAAVLTFMNDLSSFLAGDMSIEELTATVQGLTGSWAEGSRAVGTFVGDTIANIRGLVDGVLGLGADIRGAGSALIQNFIDGINEMLGPVGDAVSGVMGTVADFFPHSPAKRGPFSGSGWTAVGQSGAALGDEFLGGFDAQAANWSMPGVDLSGSSAAGTAASSTGASASAGAVRAPVSQVNHFAELDPTVAVELANQQLNHLIRGS